MQNDKVYASKGCDNIVVQVGNGDKVVKKRKKIVICCNIHGCQINLLNTTNCLDLYTVANIYVSGHYKECIVFGFPTCQVCRNMALETITTKIMNMNM